MSRPLKPLSELLSSGLRASRNRPTRLVISPKRVRRCLGEPLGEHVLSAGRRGEELVIRVDSAAWSAQVRYAGRRLIEAPTGTAGDTRSTGPRAASKTSPSTAAFSSPPSLHRVAVRSFLEPPDRDEAKPGRRARCRREIPVVLPYRASSAVAMIGASPPPRIRPAGNRATRRVAHAGREDLGKKGRLRAVHRPDEHCPTPMPTEIQSSERVSISGKSTNPQPRAQPRPA